MIPSQPFGSLKKLFDEAANAVLKEKWDLIQRARFWYDVLPYPDLAKFVERPTLINLLGVIPYHGSNPNSEWQNWAMEFFDSRRKFVDQKLSVMHQALEDQIVAWNCDYPQKGLQLDLKKLDQELQRSIENWTLAEFQHHHTWEKTVSEFVDVKKNELKSRIGSPNEKNWAIRHAVPGRTQRQYILLYCYQDLPGIQRGNMANKLAEDLGFTSGESLYQDFVKYATTRKRIRYTDDSIRKAEQLINDIEDIMVDLTPSQKERAEREINTIKTKFCNQL